MKKRCVSVLAGYLVCAFASAQEPPALKPLDPAAITNPAARSASAEQLEAWRKSTAAAPPTGTGCYRLDYPATTWQKIACGPPPPDLPNTLNPRLVTHTGVRAAAPALSGDYTMTPVSNITSVTGRMIALNQVTSVGSVNANTKAVNAGSFSLQINSNTGIPAKSATPSCSDKAASASCNGWIQFVYNNNRALYIQAWFLKYLSSTSQTCPSNLPANDASIAGLDCGENVVSITLPATAPNDFTKMQQVTLTGQVLTGKVIAILTAGGTAYTASATDPFGIGTGWKTAEFNIFGYGTIGSGKTAIPYNTVQLNTAAQVTMGLTKDYDVSLETPSCSTGSTTNENSNMFLGPCAKTSTPGIWFNESPNTPTLTSINPSQGPVAGGTPVQILATFTQPITIQFNSITAPPTNTLPNDISVNSPANGPGPAAVAAAYTFLDGGLGPFSATLPFTYFTTPGCTFSEYCPVNDGQHPSYTATCTTPSDFYTTTNSQVIGDFNLVSHDTTTITGVTSPSTLLLAACQVGSKVSCDFDSLQTSSVCKGTTPPPPACTKCGAGMKCCPNPNNDGKTTLCLPAAQQCPVLQ